MKRPENFGLINNVKFIANNNQFKIEVDTMQHNYVWVFPTAHSNFEHCLLFNMDWETEQYFIKKCKIGDGDWGDEIVGKTRFTKKDVLTKTTFVDKFLKELTDWIVDNRLL